MSNFIRQYQNIIQSNDAIELGREETAKATGAFLQQFLNDIVDNAMKEPNKAYLIQWAISELDDDEVKDAAKER